MQEFLEFTLGGISVGMIYAAIALSLVLIWRGTRILNYSQGGMAMFTTYVALDRHQPHRQLLAGLRRGAGRRPGPRRRAGAHRRPAGGQQAAAERRHRHHRPADPASRAWPGMIYGGQFRSFPPAFSITGLKHRLSSRSASPATTCSSPRRCWSPRSLLAAIFQLHLGRPADARDGVQPRVARLLGVRVGRMLTLGWALAGLIGALAGVLVTPPTFLYPNSMDAIFVLGFTAAVIGGLESPVGAVVGGLLLGVAAQLRRRLPGRDLVRAVRPRRAGARPDGPAVRPVLPDRSPAGVTMTLATPRRPRAARRAWCCSSLSDQARPVPRLPDRRGRRLRRRGRRADPPDRAQRPDLDRQRRVHGHRRLCHRAAAAASAAGRWSSVFVVPAC